MSKPLIIVESPTKAKSITKYLGNKYQVIASKGHVRDLPKTQMGVDVENGFEPKYVTLKEKKAVIDTIKKAAAGADEILLAPDPDREGEAIAWHIMEILKKVNTSVRRVLFNEITKKGVIAGLEHPRELDKSLFESQQARRILDRLVGYELSPLLWKKVKRGLSAGRVQSVTVRLIVERERAINAFVPEEYWNLACIMGHNGEEFKAILFRIDGEKAKVSDGETASKLEEILKRGEFRIVDIIKKQSTRRPSPPFITSTLQQEAARKLSFPARKTMQIAQKLYEGMELGKEKELTGLITYMRTDSTRVSADALNDARALIDGKFGQQYLPDKPNFYKTKKSAQDAHEAIRPTDAMKTPEEVEKLLVASGSNTKDRKDLVRLYSLIWKRFIASQMKNAIFDVVQVDISRENLILRAQGTTMRFPGFTKVYEEGKDNIENDENDTTLPQMEKGDVLDLVKILKEQKFTQPPPRFSEATLIKELEDKGIGRPSTYANIISTVLNRKYVEREKGRFKPTELGDVVTQILVDSFPDILNVEFTAKMEQQLDDVEENKVQWRTIIGDFYNQFHSSVKTAETNVPSLKSRIEETDIDCDVCGAKMVIRWGRNGKFLACSKYPDCKNTKEVKIDGETVTIVKPELREEKCPKCGKPMVVRRGKFGSFLGCTDYPECKGTLPMLLPFKCPREGCGGTLVERKGKKKIFYGCTNYKNDGGCDFSTWDEPVKKECPQCGFDYMFKSKPRKSSRTFLKCPKCNYSMEEND
ncbi:MAG: type I DNA topoisomerase [Deltaproteobacteria bacterium]|nr:type I DNA topoisomerase [Deltaproteobacteria bacterium]